MTLTPVQQAALTAEIEHLTEGMRHESDKAKFARAVRFNVANWEELRARDPAEFQWLALDAWVARQDAITEPDSVFRPEYLSLAAERTLRLYDEAGRPDYPAMSLTAIRLVLRFHPRLLQERTT